MASDTPHHSRQTSAAGFRLIQTTLDDAFVIERPRFEDHRGVFIKTFNEDIFAALGLPTVFREAVCSISSRNVLRGMHFQRHPHGHGKLVHVIEGEILDVIVGVGGASNAHNKGKFFSTVLSAANNRSLFIPEGYAHGFLCLSERAIVSYMTTTGYCPESDTGIHYDSFGFEWPTVHPVISEKDRNLCPLERLEGQ